MPRIPIITDSRDAAVPKFVAKSNDLSRTVPRCKAPGGKPPLPLKKSYNKQVTD